MTIAEGRRAATAAPQVPALTLNAPKAGSGRAFAIAMPILDGGPLSLGRPSAVYFENDFSPPMRCAGEHLVSGAHLVQW